jgi:hypothetical protein
VLAASVAAQDAAEAALTTATHADSQLRAQLTAAVTDLAGAGGVLSAMTEATAAVTAATASVVASDAAWHAAQAVRPAAVAAVRTPAPVVAAGTAASSVPVAGGLSLLGVAQAELASLPGSSGVSISWNDPDLSGHLGAVWLGNTTTIMVNGAKLVGQPGKVRDVVRHEIGHIYQGRLMASTGLSGQGLFDRMVPAFGSNGQELSADCVAQRLGATWLHYSGACADPGKQAWVDGLLGGYVP